MALKVIGAGFGRTGTLSLKAALEELGFGPCHHMSEVFASPRQLALWQSVVDGSEIDWNEIFYGYSACVDWPSAYFWQSLAEHYADARVILGTRDPETWYESFNRTILHLAKTVNRIEDPHTRGVVDMGNRIIRHGVFGNTLPTRERAVEVFREHEERVKRAIDPARLLVFDIRQGWEPLCEFLDVDVPATDFPRLNDERQFKELVGEAP